MGPLWIILIGMAVVVGGILVLRLHAFLSLIAGALAVALFTPTSFLYRYTLRSGAIEASIGSANQTVTLHPKSKLMQGSPLLVYVRAETATGYRQIATLRVTGDNIAEAVSGELPQKLGDDDFVVEPSADASARKTLQQTVGERIAEGFGRTTLEVGILIGMAAIVGKSLMLSGAAEKIVESCRRALGDRHAAVAFLVSGFVLAALILSDTTFYLLIPLAQVMRVRCGRDYLLYILACVAGATMTHSLVPPAAGPITVAAELHVELLPMIFGGIVIGAIAAASGYAYALWANSHWEIPLRPSLGVSQADLERLAQRNDSMLPPLWMSVLPILLPVLLIAANAVAGKLTPTPNTATLLRVIKTIGEKNVALTIAAAVGLSICWMRRNTSEDQTERRKKSTHAIAEGLASAGAMVLIIGAGGAFGYMMRQTDVANTLKQMLPSSKLAILPLAFVVTALVRGAQGSAIVSMITGVGIVAPLAAGGTLGFHPVYLALAIGCGSKPCLWMNDAGFWIIGRMSGMTEAETLKSVSVMMTIMGIVGLGATMLGAWVLPFK